MKLKLYHYWRSSASWRVRFALDHKKIECELVHVSIINGESQGDAYKKKNPMGLVPALEVSGVRPDAFLLSESLAILDFFEEEFAYAPALLPRDKLDRARAKQLAEIINAATQPLQNLSVMKAVSDDPAIQKKWSQKWIARGLESYEKWASQSAGLFSVGDQLSWADLCLIPQLYNAKRNDIDLSHYPTLLKIESNAVKLPAYKSSEPSNFEPKP